MISDKSSIPKEARTLNQSTNFWSMDLPLNVVDYEVPGILVFRGFSWMFKRIMTVPLFLFFQTVLFNKGLRQKMCSHDGSFYMVGPRQTSMASSSMTKPATEGTDHDYWDKKNNEYNTSSLCYVHHCCTRGTSQSTSKSLWGNATKPPPAVIITCRYIHHNCKNMHFQHCNILFFQYLSP